MSDNMRLLSQEEIDALVAFLTQKKNINGQVLDQKSIDILVSVLQDPHLMRKINMTEIGAGRTVLPGLNQTLLLEDEADLMLQRANCHLIFEKNDDETVCVICENKNTGKRYNMPPTCFESGIAPADGENTWGKAVAPIIFDAIAALLQVTYSRKTFTAVCECYAEVVYGDKEKVLPSIYMPNGNQLMQHMNMEA